MWSVVVFWVLLSSSSFLLKGTKGSEFFFLKPEDSPSYCYGELKLRDIEVVFESKPFDYEVDLPLSASANVPTEISDFNPYFAQLSEPSFLYFAKEYFGLFSTLYPGLANVPLFPTDVEDLILFGLLHMTSNDVAFFPSQFILLSTELSRAFGDTETFCEFANVDDWSLVSKSDVLKILLEWALWRRSFYTVEAFFQMGLEAFSQENLLFAMRLSRELGDLRMVNRIASKLDPEACQNVFSSELPNCSWPKIEGYSLMQSNILTVPIYKSAPVSFEFLEVLGNGTYGICQKAFSRTSGKHFALKLIHKTNGKGESSRSRLKLQREIMIQQSLAHEGVVKLYHVIEDALTIYLIMELCTGSSLLDVILKSGPFIEEQASSMTNQIVSALDHIHRKGIIHRDIKLENLLLKQPGQLVQIADFGLSTFVSEDGKAKSVCGSKEYLAPEIVAGKAYSFEVDIWSLGVTLFSLVTARLPFSAEDRYKKILAGRFHFPSKIPLSGSVKKLICNMLTVSRRRRITLEQIQNHPFLKTELDSLDHDCASEELSK